MNKNQSIYLDLIRFFAAVMVFMSHVPQFIGGNLWQLGSLGHEAVVVFFVLSGYVIAYVCIERKETLTEYAVNRLVRIYSVAIPAVILTLLCYFIILEINPKSIEVLLPTLSPIGSTILSALTFTNQTWVSTRILVNLPYWSMSFEVMYYVLFCFLFYFTGLKRIFLCVFLLCLVGPSIALYVPMWLCGVLAFKLKDSINLSVGFLIVLFLLSIAAMSVLLNSNVQNYINDSFVVIAALIEAGVLHDVTKDVISDYMIAVVFVFNLIVANSIFKNVSFVVSFKPILILQKFSAHTFSLYLLHMPLLYLSSAVFPFKDSPFESLLFALIVTPVIIFVISHFIEKYRKRMAVGFYRLLHIK
jgi:peptidoglycan/LPS O-acetylase OafA/YrhL